LQVCDVLHNRRRNAPYRAVASLCENDNSAKTAPEKIFGAGCACRRIETLHLEINCVSSCIEQRRKFAVYSVHSVEKLKKDRGARASLDSFGNLKAKRDRAATGRRHAHHQAGIENVRRDTLSAEDAKRLLKRRREERLYSYCDKSAASSRPVCRSRLKQLRRVRQNIDRDSRRSKAVLATSKGDGAQQGLFDQSFQ
jgi:hypothetical protein